MKIVLNRCFGGFSISKKAAEFMANNGCERAKKELEESERQDGHWYGFGFVKGVSGGYDRTSEHLVLAVETLGKEANGDLSSLVVVEIPDGIDYYIDEYDGMETVREHHRSW